MDPEVKAEGSEPKRVLRLEAHDLTSLGLSFSSFDKRKSMLQYFNG